MRVAKLYSSHNFMSPWKIASMRLKTKNLKLSVFIGENYQKYTSIFFNIKNLLSHYSKMEYFSFITFFNILW